MDWFDYVIVGSGPAGVSAARRLIGKNVCVVDVGEVQKSNFPYRDRIAALDSGNYGALLGSNWEMLANLSNPDCVHPKLRAPGLRHVMSGENFHVLNSLGETILNGAGSYAAGGMSNAWGAQLLRYTDADLRDVGDWPIGVLDLERYYRDLEDHIGIAGMSDDMDEFLGGGVSNLLPPVPIVPAAQYLLERYQIKKSKLPNSTFCLGRARLAIATSPYRNRQAYSFGETEFYTTGQKGLYTASCTLADLFQSGAINYIGGFRLENYKEFSEYVEIHLVNCTNNLRKIIRCRHLLLGCGTIQTARLVLLNKQEHSVTLPFIDHPPTLLPLFLLGGFSGRVPKFSFPIQLVGTFQGVDRRDMISFYYPGAMLWSDLLSDIPFPMDLGISIMGELLGKMLVAQIWQTSRPTPKNFLRLNEGGQVEITYTDILECSVLDELLRALRPLGAYSLKRFASTSPPGWGFHHAGCLPMRKHPRAFETHIDGRLWDSKRIRLIDGSVLPSLPAKNHSLTIMANAARIADEVKQCEY